MDAVDQPHLAWWPATESTTEPDARQAVVWALLGLLIPVFPSLVAIHVARRAARTIGRTRGRTGLLPCRLALAIAFAGLIWGVTAIVAVLAHL